MKIAISASGKDMMAPVDERFGRAPGFILFDDTTAKFEYINNNKNLEAAQGAGIQSAKTVIDSGSGVLITGNVGPKAYATLSSAGIEIYLTSGGTIEEAISAYRAGTLTKVDNANVEGHW